MRLLSSSGTEHVAPDNGRFCSFCVSVSFTYRDHRVLFHSAYLATAIDVATNGAAADNNLNSTIGILNACAINSHHGFLAFECVF